VRLEAYIFERGQIHEKLEMYGVVGIGDRQ
jgi:hypothetical protein